jgi:hypothetical protein
MQVYHSTLSITIFTRARQDRRHPSVQYRGTSTTISIPVNIHHSIRLNLGTGVSTRTGSDYDVAGLIKQYRLGAGLPKVKKLQKEE